MKRTRTAKATRATKATRTKRKTPRKSPVRRHRRRRNVASDRALSFDLPAKDAMPEQAKRAPRQRVRASIDRVMAECDKVDAVLIGITRPRQDHDLPPLAPREIDTDDGAGGTTRAWAVVSGDPQMPLTETQVKTIIAALQSRCAPAPTSIAAE
jgi:hypothetical protein